MAKARKKRTRYSSTQKQTILAAAQKEGMTAAQVQKKFGVTPVTYYSWRRKTGATRRRGPGRPPGRPAGTTRVANGSTNVIAEVRAGIRQRLPEIVRSEVNSYLDSLFGVSRGRGRRRV
jgi:transposase-like protein